MILFFFKKGNLNFEKLLNFFSKLNGKLIYKSENTLYFEINGIKISLFGVDFEIFYDCYPCGKIKLVNLENIAIMKLVAILQRAEFKDYVDLYWIFKKTKISLTNLITKISKVYNTQINSKLFLEALVYTKDLNENVDFLPTFKVDKEEIQTFFEKLVKEFYDKVNV